MSSGDRQTAQYEKLYDLVTTCLEKLEILEMSGILTPVKEMSGILISSGKSQGEKSSRKNVQKLFVVSLS